jgi:hypothetical protein
MPSGPLAWSGKIKGKERERLDDSILGVPQCDNRSQSGERHPDSMVITIAHFSLSLSHSHCSDPQSIDEALLPPHIFASLLQQQSGRSSESKNSGECISRTEENMVGHD